MKILKVITIICTIVFSTVSFSQNYHALAGSPYAGVEGIYHNPASSINSVYSWDVTIFSAQLTLANQAFVFKNASTSSLNINSSAYQQASLKLTNGNMERNLNGDGDFSILNFRCKINKKSAFSFGLRGRGYLNAYSDPFVYSDTMSSVKSFMGANLSPNGLSASVIHSGWLEANFNYSRVYLDNDERRITWGATLGIMKGLSGMEFNPRQVTFAKGLNGLNQPYYYINGGNYSYRYTSNYDNYDSSKSANSNFNSMLSNSTTSLSLNLGVEYIIKKESVTTYTSYGKDNWNARDYYWKFGAALMDLGTNYYTEGTDAAEKNVPTGLITDTLISSYSLSNVANLKDTLLHSYQNTRKLTGSFSIANPTRLVLYADRNLGNNFYVNGELTVNFFTSRAKSKARTSEINLLIVTPRWETKGLGFYLPVQLNNEMQFWVGAAMKLGPLLVGVHNLGFLSWFKKGDQQLNGGGYIMLSIHPFGRDKEAAECPSKY